MTQLTWRRCCSQGITLCTTRAQPRPSGSHSTSVKWLCYATWHKLRGEVLFQGQRRLLNQLPKYLIISSFIPRKGICPTNWRQEAALIGGSHL
eukprot:scaffold380812_cov52-Prasinocladus_malaysianus.AAC.1